MAASPTSIEVPPLNKQRMSELVAKAKRMGLDAGEYAKLLIEDGLALQREAESSSFAEIMGPVRDAAVDASDAEITRLVETARADHHAGGRRKKR